jgi:hypothetical protein
MVTVIGGFTDDADASLFGECIDAYVFGEPTTPIEVLRCPVSVTAKR